MSQATDYFDVWDAIQNSQLMPDYVTQWSKRTQSRARYLQSIKQAAGPHHLGQPLSPDLVAMIRTMLADIDAQQWTEVELPALRAELRASG